MKHINIFYYKNSPALWTSETL